MNPAADPVPVADPNGEDRWMNQVYLALFSGNWFPAYVTVG